MSIPLSFLIPICDSMSPGLTGCHLGGGWLHSAALSLSFLCRIIFSDPTAILIKWNQSNSSSLGSRSSFQREKAKTKDIWICMYVPVSIENQLLTRLKAREEAPLHHTHPTGVEAGLTTF